MAEERPQNGAIQDLRGRVDGWLSCAILVSHADRALLLGIREGRCSNQVDGIRALKAGDETFTNSGIHGAVRSARLMCKAGEILFDELFFEVFARIPGDNLLTH